MHTKRRPTRGCTKDAPTTSSSPSNTFVCFVWGLFGFFWLFLVPELFAALHAPRKRLVSSAAERDDFEEATAAATRDASSQQQQPSQRRRHGRSCGRPPRATYNSNSGTTCGAQSLLDCRQEEETERRTSRCERQQRCYGVRSGFASASGSSKHQQRLDGLLRRVVARQPRCSQEHWGR